MQGLTPLHLQLFGLRRQLARLLGRLLRPFHQLRNDLATALLAGSAGLRALRDRPTVALRWKRVPADVLRACVCAQRAAWRTHIQSVWTSGGGQLLELCGPHISDLGHTVFVPLEHGLRI